MESKKKRKEKKYFAETSSKTELKDIQNRLVLPEAGGWGVGEMDKGSQSYGEGWKLDFCW